MRLLQQTLLCLALGSVLGLSGCNSLPSGQRTPDADAHPAGTESSGATPSATPTKRVTDRQAPTAAKPPLKQVGTQPTPPGDLWQRVRDGFAMRTRNNPRIERERERFLRHPKYLERIRDRAATYLHHIVTETERRGMPLELTLLPVVESAFQPFAYSPGRAAGIWQFIPSTGKEYGLKQNWWYDGRRDIIQATDAALDYLQASAEQFDGDWELALAAYNAGAGTVGRAIKRNERQGKPLDYWSLKLPRETQRYVPKLLAVAQIVADPEAHGVDLPKIEDRPVFTSVDIGSQLDLALAAEMAGITIEELYRLNPGFNRWATAPGGPHRLNLPLERVEAFKAALAGLPDEQRLTWKRYRIRNGDTLGGIAARHHTTVALLKEVNKIPGNAIRAGKHLLIPISAKNLKQYALSAPQRQKRLQEQGDTGNKRIHTVRGGDSLWSIARRYAVNHKALARWNGIAPDDTLRIGQRLVVRGAAQQPAAAIATAPAQSHTRLRYTVRRGDSLERIAERFKVTVNELRQWNDFNSKYLQPGQVIRLYVDVTEQTSL
ncbi:MAG: LysM peptidoglycan-binding domain-containing protein [Candidatus Sedimenticola endophacoides]